MHCVRSHERHRGPRHSARSPRRIDPGSMANAACRPSPMEAVPGGFRAIRVQAAPSVPVPFSCSSSWVRPRRGPYGRAQVPRIPVKRSRNRNRRLGTVAMARLGRVRDILAGSRSSLTADPRPGHQIARQAAGDCPDGRRFVFQAAIRPRKSPSRTVPRWEAVSPRHRRKPWGSMPCAKPCQPEPSWSCIR